MNVVERCAGVGMTELLFCDFWRVARVHDEGRNGVPESMKTASRNIERVEDWPKPVFHDVVARRRPVVSGSEQPTLWVSGPDRVVLPQNVCERIPQSHRRRTRLALCGLSFSIPRRAADVNAFVMKVDIRSLQAERFACTQSRKRQDDKERAPGFVCERENRFDLGTGEMCGDVDISFGEYKLAKRYFHARISPILSGREH
jgi:hypothetical protein